MSNNKQTLSTAEFMDLWLNKPLPSKCVFSEQDLKNPPPISSLPKVEVEVHPMSILNDSSTTLKEPERLYCGARIEDLTLGSRGVMGGLAQDSKEKSKLVEGWLTSWVYNNPSTFMEKPWDYNPQITAATTLSRDEPWTPDFSEFISNPEVPSTQELNVNLPIAATYADLLEGEFDSDTVIVTNPGDDEPVEPGMSAIYSFIVPARSNRVDGKWHRVCLLMECDGEITMLPNTYRSAIVDEFPVKDFIDTWRG